MTSSKLSPTLFTVFKQYKKDTARVATWLGDTASSLGYDFDSTPQDAPNPSPPPPPLKSKKGTPTAKSAPRPKGKARKQQREHAAAAAAASSYSLTPSATATADQPTRPPKSSVVDLDADVPTTIMTTTQFLGLARFIADTDPPVTVPTRVIDWACRAVMARRECAKWFRTPAATDGAEPENDSSESVEESNRKHEHFIGVLEQVVDILAARVGYQQSGQKAKSQQHQQQARPVMTGVELLESRYAALAIESDQQGPAAEDEANDDDDNGEWDAAVTAAVKETLASNNTTVPANSSGRRRKFQVKCDEDIEQEFFSRYLSLIEDFAVTREVILETWSLYLANMEDLETASLTTMIAIDKMQAAHDSLAAEYPTLLSNHVKYARIALRQECARNGWSDKLNKNGDCQDIRVWNHSRSLFLPLLETVEPLRLDMHTCKCGHLHPSPFVEPDTPWTPKVQVACWRHNLTQFFNNYKFFVEKVQPNINYLPIPAYEALTSLKNIPLGQSIPLMPLFILDVHVSIVEELQSEQPNHYHARVWADIQAANRFHMSSLAHFEANLPPKTSSLWNDQIQRHLNSFVNKLLFWLTDLENFNDAQSWQDRRVAYEIFAQCPMFAGMVLMRTRCHVLAFTTAQVDSWQSVLYGAYVHETLRLTSDDDKDNNNGHWHKDSWPLMRKFIDLYGAESIFFGREPDSMRSLWTSMNLAFGTLTLKDLQSWQESSILSGHLPLMRYRGLSPTRSRVGRDMPKNKRGGGGGGGARGRAEAAFHGKHGANCNDEIKRIVKVDTIIGSYGPVGASGVAMRLLTRSVLVDRLYDSEGPPRTAQINFQNLIDIEAAVINGMCKGATSAQKRIRRPLPIANFLRELRFQLGRDFMPVFKHDLLRLHVQSVKVLLMLREEIVEKGRMIVLIRRCDKCLRRDDFLPITVWNLIRALGADEGTGQPLGPVVTEVEKKVGLALVAQVKELVAEF